MLLWWRKRRPPVTQKHYKIDPKLPAQHFNDGLIGGGLSQWLTAEQGDQLDWEQWPDALLFSDHEPRFWDEREQGLQAQGVKLYPATPMPY
jgi:hypothetical protein